MSDAPLPENGRSEHPSITIARIYNLPGCFASFLGDFRRKVTFTRGVSLLSRLSAQEGYTMELRKATDHPSSSFLCFASGVSVSVLDVEELSVCVIDVSLCMKIWPAQGC